MVSVIHVSHCYLMSQDIQTIKNELVAQGQQMDKVMKLIAELSQNVVHIMEQNRSSSGSDGRFYCPLNCGADFGKVRRFSRSCFNISCAAGELFARPPVQVMQYQPAAEPIPFSVMRI